MSINLDENVAICWNYRMVTFGHWFQTLNDKGSQSHSCSVIVCSDIAQFSCRTNIKYLVLWNQMGCSYSEDGRLRDLNSDEPFIWSRQTASACSSVCNLSVSVSPCWGSKCFVTGWMLTLRLLMSYLYGAPILDSRSHTTTQHSR